MKANEMKIFVFIASVIVGILISLNISFSNSNSAIMVSSQQYRKMTESKLELQKEILNLKEQLYNNKTKLNRYENSASSGIIKEMEQELEHTNLLLGATEVTGEGILISIKDHSSVFDGTIDDAEWSDDYIIHNTDLTTLIKVLRSAGAKAISVNGIRFIGTSSFTCDASFIGLDGIKIPAPFQISAIGNKDLLYNYVNNEDGFVNYLRSDLRKINVFIDKKDNIAIPAYVGDLKAGYLKSTDN